MKQRLLTFSLLILSFWISLQQVVAQCTQCKSAAAAKDEAGNLYIGASMNTGILYLLFLPFLAVILVGGYWVYRNRQMSKAEQG